MAEEAQKKRGRPPGSKNKGKKLVTEVVRTGKPGRPRHLIQRVAPLSDEYLNEPAWERMTGEPDKEFALFCYYKALGPTRTMGQLFKEELKNDPELAADPDAKHRRTKWYENLEVIYRWRERVAAYESEEAREAVAIVEARIKSERDKRYSLLDTAREKATEFIEALDPNIHEIKPHELIKLAAILNDDSRKEYEEPLREQKRLEAAQKTNGVQNLAGLLNLAQTFLQQQQINEVNRRKAEESLPELPEENPIEAEFKTVNS